jgi:kynurenine formamidase
MQSSTQIDGLRHFGHPDKGFYNGTDPDLLVAGEAELGIQAVAQRGIVGRGLLIDVGRFRDSIGRPIDLDSNEQIPVSDLDDALEAQSSAVMPGDIVMIRTGWLGHFRQQRLPDEPAKSPGLEQSEQTAAWLWDRQIALVAADNIALEAWPASDSTLTVEAETLGTLPRSAHSGMLHRILIPLLGFAIGELWDLDALAVACLRRGRFECFVTAQPLNMLGGVGSPANALAVI